MTWVSGTLVKPPDPAAKTRERLAILEEILARHPHVDRENAWHTLLLLELSPIERLERGLVRGRRVRPSGRLVIPVLEDALAVIEERKAEAEAEPAPRRSARKRPRR